MQKWKELRDALIAKKALCPHLPIVIKVPAILLADAVDKPDFDPNPLKQWCYDNCIQSWYANDWKFYFKDPDDAMRFKLTWC